MIELSNVPAARTRDCEAVVFGVLPGASAGQMVSQRLCEMHESGLLGAVDVIVLSRFDGNADNPTLSRSLLNHCKRLRAKHRRSEQ